MLRGVSLASIIVSLPVDTRTYSVNMQVSKIYIFAGSGYPLLISVLYPLRVLSTNTYGYEFFWHS